MLKRLKHATAKHTMPYDQRILNYNLEKQSALSLASTPEEADHIIRYLRKKWGI